MDAKKYTQRLSQLVAQPSVSSTSAELDMSNEAVITTLANWLETYGFICNIQTVDADKKKVNLIATLGQGSGGLVLSGHTDTVPFNAERWQQDPFQLTLKEDKLYGLGATDMKGFFPVVLAALDNLKDQLPTLTKPIIVLATADEESSMSGARALVKAGFSDARYAVIGEPTALRPIRMHKGITMEKIRVTGQAGHSSNPNLGNSALEAMHEVMGDLLTYRSQLQEKYRNPQFEIAFPTLNMGCIHGGDNPNRICGHCEMLFDLRPLPGMPIAELHREITARIKPIGEKRNIAIELDMLFGGVEAFEEPAHSELIGIVEGLTSNQSESVAFATEAPFLQALGMQTVVLGPGSIDQAHQPNEFIDTKQLTPATEIITSLIQELCFK